MDKMEMHRHARRELDALGHTREPIRWSTSKLIDLVLAVITTMGKRFFTDDVETIAIEYLQSLLNFKLLSPLTGDDREWKEIEPGLFQNKRCPSVFKDENGAYEKEGVIQIDQNGPKFIDGETNRSNITFPYWPFADYWRNKGGEWRQV